MSHNPKILRTLRIKFILMNMLLAAIVLAGAFGTVCYLDYVSRLDTVYSELELVLSDAASPHIPQIAGIQQLSNGEIRVAKSSTDLASGTTISSSSNTYSVPTIGDSATGRGRVILMAVYSVEPNGIYTLISDYTTAAIPESVILRANETALKSSSDRGFIPEFNLYFERAASPDDPQDFLVAYADGSSVNDWQTLAATLSLVGLAGLVVLFFVNIFFSRWALRPIAASIKQQQQFTADASHELKTPLTVILANMAILKSQPELEVADQMQWIDSTETEAERMQLLVNDMLALSRPDEQKVTYVKEDVDFSDLVEGEVLQFESVAFELGVTIDDDVESGITVEGNRERLGRMVATLIDNACKYASKGDSEDEPASNERKSSSGDETSDSSAKDEDAPADVDADGPHDDEDEFAAVKNGGPRVNVTLEAVPASGMHRAEARLTVHNNGPAIPEEDLPNIFNRFYRADKVRTSSKGGYGLGLAIGQEIVLEHNGNITAESSPAAGTTFTVTIPLTD